MASPDLTMLWTKKDQMIIIVIYYNEEGAFYTLSRFKNVSKSCDRVFLARAVTPQENLPLSHRPPGTCVLLTVTWIQNMEHDSARECHSDGYRFNWSLKTMTSRPTARGVAISCRFFEVIHNRKTMFRVTNKKKRVIND